MGKNIIFHLGRLLFVLSLIAIANQAVFASSPTLLRKPTIHNVTPTSLVIVWTTEEDGSSEVRYGTGDFSLTAVATTTNLITDASSPYDNYYVHEATLTGLSSNTVYQYKIYTDGVDLTPGGSIDVRSGRAAGDKNFRFATFGDSGTGSSGQRGVADRLLQIDPDLVVHGGDMVYDTDYRTIETKHFQIYEELLQSVWLPPNVGNHDMHNGGAVIADSFVNPPNSSTDPIARELYYSFDYGNAHFTVLATELSTSNGSEQYQWLEDDLANSDMFWKIVVLHEPPFNGDGKKFSNLVDLFEAHGVDMVIAGDRHYYERMKLIKDDDVSTIEDGGILYVTSGGGGTGLGNIGAPPWPERTAERAAVYHLVMFDVADCEIELSAVEQSTGDGFDATDIFDTFTLNKCGDGPTATFTADVKSGEAPLTVNFTDFSSGSPTEWTWDFGDGNGSTDQNPTHTYTADGTYTVSLTVGDGVSTDTETRENYIEVAPPVVSFSLSAVVATVDETAVSTSLNVLLPDPAPEAVTVDYEVVAGTATADVDYTAVSGTLSFAMGESLQLLTLPILDDLLDEADETFTVRLLNPSLGSVGTPSEAVVTITDNDEPPTVQWEAAEVNGAEGVATQVMTAILSVASGQPVMVDVATADGTAVSAADYTAVSETLTFAPGETSQTVTVSIVDDLVEEGSETLTAMLSNPVNAALGTPDVATLTILDNDAPPQVSFASATYTEAEGSGTAVIPVTLLGVTTNSVMVDVATADGTAVSGDDYTMTSVTLTFPPGTMTQTVSIPLLDDSIDELTETVDLTLSNIVNADPGTLLQSELQITDDDEPPTVAFAATDFAGVEESGAATVTVELSQSSAKIVTVDYEVMDDVAGQAEAGSDYTAVSGTLTFTPGVTSQSFVVSLLDDGIDEMDETAVLTLSNPTEATLDAPNPATLTILDDDDPPTVQFAETAVETSEADEAVVVSVTLDTVSAQTITVDYEMRNGTAVSGSDFAGMRETLTFLPGETAQTISIQILDDDVLEQVENFTVELSNPENVTLGADNVATISIIDDDRPTVALDTTAITVSEDASSVIIEVVLSEASSVPAMVDYVTVAETAVANDDYEPMSGTITFAAGETSQLISLTLVDDVLDEWDETLAVQLQNPVDAVLDGDDLLTITLTDNDAPPTAEFATSAFSAHEDDGDAEIMIQLSQPSGKEIRVNFATIDDSALAGEDYTAVLTPVVFAPGTTTQLVAVPLLPDELQEGREMVELLLGNAVNVEWGAVTTAVLTIIDGDGVTLYLPIIRHGE